MYVNLDADIIEDRDRQRDYMILFVWVFQFMIVVLALNQVWIRNCLVVLVVGNIVNLKEKSSVEELYISVLQFGDCNKEDKQW